MTHLPRVGISQCLLGEEVRYDGGHKRDENVLGFLDEYFDWVPVCPEVEVDMGIPREPVQLLEAAGAAGTVGVRMVGIRSGRDWTDTVRDYSADRAEALALDRLSGFIFKRGSPSCGLAGVEICDEQGVATRTGVGLFAAALRIRAPDLPVVEEGQLTDPAGRADFISRVHAYWHRMDKGATRS